MSVVIKDILFERELDTHRIPAIEESPYIRRLVDVIDPEDEGHEVPKLVFEWMDTDLWKCRPYGNLSHPKLPEVISKSVLEALAVFQDLHAVHTDISPNNILISNLDQPFPIVKVSDLDQAFMEGVKGGEGECPQTLETRAPEVWRGCGAWPASDMWSVGVTLVHWLMSRAIFGPRGKIIKDHTDAWCMAKLMRLMGRFDMTEDMDGYKEWRLATALEAMDFKDHKTGDMRPYIVGGTLEEELESLPRELCMRECIEFILYLLELDYKKRPTALEALQHPFIKSTVTRSGWKLANDGYLLLSCNYILYL
ncbi:hypothetical protein VE03_05117 [Pseudogymnoascus sp. 23342-1-I1]|nr:hypothetical protein VE03_05117 [Pseudogymnoascus sp. 23342-1-I1]